MNTATADGWRALYGIARDDMTIKQLDSLNRWNVPGHAMTMDMVINICFVLFIGNIFGILAASNIGYVLAHFFAITGFILLRKDRPDWPRPIKLSAIWIPIAWVLAVVPRPDVLRRRLVPDRGRRLRRDDGEADRLRRPRARSCSISSAGSSRTASARTGARRRRLFPTHARPRCSRRSARLVRKGVLN